MVLVCDENAARSDWRLARVGECFTSKDNLVRFVNLQVATPQLDIKGKRLTDATYLMRPIHKLILIERKQHRSVPRRWSLNIILFIVFALIFMHNCLFYNAIGQQFVFFD